MLLLAKNDGIQEKPQRKVSIRENARIHENHKCKEVQFHNRWMNKFVEDSFGDKQKYEPNI